MKTTISIRIHVVQFDQYLLSTRRSLWFLAILVKAIRIWAAPSEKNAFEHRETAQIQLCLHMRKVLFVHLLSIHNVCSIQWFRCADAQADLGLRCPHMPKDTFSYDAAHMRKDIFCSFTTENCYCPYVTGRAPVFRCVINIIACLAEFNICSRHNLWYMNIFFFFFHSSYR